MKQLLKICYLIIFAAIVASVSTSCSDDSELFDEPVMYQTRAMMGMDTRVETSREYITNTGPSEVTRWYRVNEVQIRVKFDWKSGYNSTMNNFSAEAYFEDMNDETIYDHDYSDPYIYEYEEIIPIHTHESVPFVHFETPEMFYLAVHVEGKFIEKKYDAHTHKLIDTETIYYKEIFEAKDPVTREKRPYSLTFSNPAINTPINFVSTDSLNIQNQ